MADLELPRPLRLLRTMVWSLAESAGLPLVALAVGAWLGGRDAGLLAGVGATWVTAAVRKVTTGSVPGLLTISAIARTPNPLLARLAAEVVGLRQPAHHPGLHRFFQGGTWLWSGVFGLLAACLAVLMVSEPTAVFLMLSTVATVALIVAGACVSVLWLTFVLRKHGLALRFAPA
jgi:hypothetical protein